MVLINSKLTDLQQKWQKGCTFIEDLQEMVSKEQLYKSLGSTKKKRHVMEHNPNTCVEAGEMLLKSSLVVRRARVHHMHLEGTDIEESMFGHMCTLTHNRNSNLAEANVNLSTAHQIIHILEEYPQWSSSSRPEDKFNS